MFKFRLSLRFQLVQLICVCAMCVGFALSTGLNYFSVCVCFGEPTSTLLMCFCLLLLVSLRLARSILRHSPFFTWFVGLPRSHRLSSHSRLNAFVIQAKLRIRLSKAHPAIIAPRRTALATACTAVVSS